MAPAWNRMEATVGSVRIAARAPSRLLGRGLPCPATGHRICGEHGVAFGVRVAAATAAGAAVAAEGPPVGDQNGQLGVHNRTVRPEQGEAASTKWLAAVAADPSPEDRRARGADRGLPGGKARSALISKPSSADTTDPTPAAPPPHGQQPHTCQQIEDKAVRMATGEYDTPPDPPRSRVSSTTREGSLA